MNKKHIPSNIAKIVKNSQLKILVRKFTKYILPSGITLLISGIIFSHAFNSSGAILNPQFSGDSVKGSVSRIVNGIRAPFAKAYYSLFPNKYEEDFKKTDFKDIVKDEGLLTFWLQIAGIEKVLDKTQEDLTGTEDVKICHLTYHIIGRLSYEVFKKQAFSVFDQDCSAGYTHGLVYQYSIDNNSASLMSNLYDICSKVSPNVYKLECFHGIGHGVLMHNKYDLGKAMSQCKQLPAQPVRNLCFSGAFMENLLAIGGHGAESSHGAHGVNSSSPWLSDDPFAPCNKLERDSNIQSTCSVYQAGRMLDLYNGDFGKTAELCLSREVGSQRLCFVNIGQEAAYRNLGDPKKIVALCKINQQFFQDCLDGAIRHFVYFYADKLGERALNLCRTVQGSYDKNFCYKYLGTKLAEIYYGMRGVNEIMNECENVEAEYKNACLEGTKVVPILF